MRIVDAGFLRKNSRYPFFVVEYLPNTLRDAMRRGIPMVEKLSYLLQLLSAVQYLGSLKPPRAHCDVKPENIFIKGRSCVLGDFGLLRSCDGKAPDEGTGEIPMPKAYRTPDLVNHGLRKSALTSASDVFQLGLVAAELFSGENPQIPLDGTDKLVAVQLRPIAEIPGDLGGAIKGLITRMLKSDPRTRPPIDNLIDGWQGVFFRAAKIARGLEGRVFQ
jgi:serine/threonine protein kinase